MKPWSVSKIILDYPILYHINKINISCFLWKYWIVILMIIFKIHDGKPHDSNSGYAHAKRIIDIANRYKLTAIIISTYKQNVSDKIYANLPECIMSMGHVIIFLKGIPRTIWLQLH